MSVARGQLRPRITDSNDGAAIEEMIGKALILGPTAMDEAAFIGPPEPILTAKLSLLLI